MIVAPWLRGYDRAWLSKDIVGGIAAGAVVIPQAMAYATIADLPVEIGLYTCMVPMAVYALLGGSRTISVSTTSTIAVLTGSTLLAAGVAADSADPAEALSTLTLLVGLILLLTRVLRLGSVIDNISEATLTGVKYGVGLSVAAGQLPKVLGVPEDPDADNFFEKIGSVLDHLDEAVTATVVLSAVTIAGLLILRRVAPAVPGPLVAVIGGILAVQLFAIDDDGVSLIAAVPSGLPTPVLPSFDHVGGLLPGAFAIAIMAFLETVAVARQVRRPEEPSIDNDQELTANGLSCVLGAFFRGMPSAGGFSQSAINQRAGARTQLSELVTVVLAILCALFLGGVLSDMPQATLGCLVMVAVLGLIDPRELVRFWKFRVEFWVVIGTAFTGLFFGLLLAVLVGVLGTFILVLVELDRIGLTELRPTADDDLVPASPDVPRVPGLLVLRFNGPVYTGNIRSVNRKILQAVDEAGDGIDVVVLDLTAVGVLSTTVLDEGVQLDRELERRGVEGWLTGLRPRALSAVATMPRWEVVRDANRVYPTALAAVRAYRELHGSS